MSQYAGNACAAATTSPKNTWFTNSWSCFRRDRYAKMRSSVGACVTPPGNSDVLCGSFAQNTAAISSAIRRMSSAST